MAEPLDATSRRLLPFAVENLEQLAKVVLKTCTRVVTQRGKFGFYEKMKDDTNN